jgi:hypothetical protein
MARLTPLAVLAAAAAIVTAGCANAGASGPGSAPGGAASVVPASTVAFAAAAADITSKDWHGLGNAALELVQKQSTFTWNDLQQVAGDEVDVAVLPGDKGVALVQPKDPAKLASFAAAHHVVTRTIGDWTALAKDASTLDTVANATTHLSDNNLYLDAMSALPSGALARAYANGDAAGKLFASIPGQLESQLLPIGAKYTYKPSTSNQKSAGFVGVQQFQWLAAALTSNGDGLTLHVVAPHGELTANGPPRLAVQPIQPYAPALVDEIPAGALAVADFQVPSGGFEMLSQLPKPLLDLFPGNTLDLPQQLDAVFGGETTIYVRAALPMPEVTLVTQPADTAAASSTLDELVKQSPQLSKLTLHRAVIGGQFVVSTTQQGIDAFRSGGSKLSADPMFLEARKQSAMPERTTAFVYGNLQDALPLLRLAGVELPQSMPKLRTLVAYGAEADGQSTFTAFLGVG